MTEKREVLLGLVLVAALGLAAMLYFVAVEESELEIDRLESPRAEGVARDASRSRRQVAKAETVSDTPTGVDAHDVVEELPYHYLVRTLDVEGRVLPGVTLAWRPALNAQGFEIDDRDHASSASDLFNASPAAPTAMSDRRGIASIAASSRRIEVAAMSDDKTALGYCMLTHVDDTFQESLRLVPAESMTVRVVDSEDRPVSGFSVQLVAAYRSIASPIHRVVSEAKTDKRGFGRIWTRDSCTSIFDRLFYLPGSAFLSPVIPTPSRQNIPVDLNALPSDTVTMRIPEVARLRIRLADTDRSSPESALRDRLGFTCSDPKARESEDEDGIFNRLDSTWKLHDGVIDLGEVGLGLNFGVDLKDPEQELYSSGYFSFWSTSAKQLHAFAGPTRAGEELIVQLPPLAPLGRLSVRVLNSGGRPLANAQLRVLPGDCDLSQLNRALHLHHTDTEGRASLPFPKGLLQRLQAQPEETEDGTGIGIGFGIGTGNDAGVFFSDRDLNADDAGLSIPDWSMAEIRSRTTAASSDAYVFPLESIIILVERDPTKPGGTRAFVRISANELADATLPHIDLGDRIAENIPLRFRGRVRDANGNDIKGAGIWIRAADEVGTRSLASNFPTLKSDEEGFFAWFSTEVTAEGSNPSRKKLFLHAPGFVPFEAPLPENATEPINVVLHPSIRLDLSADLALGLRTVVLLDGPGSEKCLQREANGPINLPFDQRQRLSFTGLQPGSLTLSLGAKSPWDDEIVILLGPEEFTIDGDTRRHFDLHEETRPMRVEARDHWGEIKDARLIRKSDGAEVPLPINMPLASLDHAAWAYAPGYRLRSLPRPIPTGRITFEEAPRLKIVLESGSSSASSSHPIRVELWAPESPNHPALCLEQQASDDEAKFAIPFAAQWQLTVTDLESGEVIPTEPTSFKLGPDGLADTLHVTLNPKTER
jgi:hypothetical protein